jgi:nuclear transport factor 2 (NTF2) superfamily protein
MSEESRPPLPPFAEETAREKVQKAEDAWNTCDPEKVSLAYTEDSVWRNRDEFFEGREETRAFLTRKWERDRLSFEKGTLVRLRESHLHALRI